MRRLFGSVARSALLGAAIGLPVLGVGGRMLMRVIAHWEGRAPVLTSGGTMTVILAGAVAGLAAGVIHALLERFVPNFLARNTLFAIICVAFTWYVVIDLLLRPRLMFVALILIFVIVFELAFARDAGFSSAPSHV